MTNPRIGTYTPEGTVYPTETLTGKPYARGEFDPPPAIVHGLGEHHFAVGDVYPPAGFDVDAALDELKAALKPAHGKKEDKP